MKAQELPTYEKWEKIGFLETTPEVRLESVIEALDFAMVLVLNGSIQYSHDDYILTRESDDKTLRKVDMEEIDIVFLPIITMVARVVDLCEEDVKEIHNNLTWDYHDGVQSLESQHHHVNYVDYEAMYCRNFADKIIDKILK